MPTLRTLLRLDAATCVLMGILLLVGGDVLTTLTGLPAGLLFYAGIMLLPVAAFMAAVSLFRQVAPLAAWVVILGNGGWIAASLLVLAGAWGAPNVFGISFVLVQAAVVAVLMIFEHKALRASAPNGATA